MSLYYKTYGNIPYSKQENRSSIHFNLHQDIPCCEFNLVSLIRNTIKKTFNHTNSCRSMIPLASEFNWQWIHRYSIALILLFYNTLKCMVLSETPPFCDWNPVPLIWNWNKETFIHTNSCWSMIPLASTDNEFNDIYQKWYKYEKHLCKFN